MIYPQHTLSFNKPRRPFEDYLQHRNPSYIVLINTKTQDFVKDDFDKDNLLNTSNNKNNTRILDRLKIDYDTMTDYYKRLSLNQVYDKLNSTIKQLEFKCNRFNFDNLSFKLSYDESIQYKLKIDSFTFYFEEFLDELDEDDYEFTITGFNDNVKLKSCNGNINSLILFINSNLN